MRNGKLSRREKLRLRDPMEGLEPRLLFANLIVNPGFAAGNSGFTSQYVNDNKTGGGYIVGTNPRTDFGPNYANFADHSPSSDGKMFMADGALTSGKTAWQEKVNVSANTTYEFSGWAGSLGGGGTDPNPAKLAFFVNGKQIGTFTVPSTNSVWAHFAASWNSGSATTATIRIVDQTTAFNGNDFALDDLRLEVPDTDDQTVEAPRMDFPANGSTLTLSNEIKPGDDVDMRAILVSAGTRMSFDIDRPNGGTFDSYLRIFDAAGTQVAANDDGAAPGENPATASYAEYTFPTTGLYFVAVSGKGNRSYNPLTGDGDAVSSATGAYTLDIKEVGDPDDQISEAHSVAMPAANASKSLTGYAITRGSDVDTFKVTLDKGQTVTFDVDAPKAVERPTGPLDSQLRIFDSTGKQLAANDNGAAPGESGTASAKESYLSFTAPADGTYYISVSSSPNRNYSASTGDGDVAGSTTGYYKLIVNNSGFANLLVNPTFSQGNVGFSTQYVNQVTQGGYKVGTNPKTDLNANYASLADHTSTSDGKFFMADGATTANKTVWQEKITITPGKTYRFGGWAASLGGGGTDPSPARLAFYINGTKIGSTFTVPSTNSQWAQFSASWNAGTATTATIRIVDLNTAVSGNDFALDDLRFARTT